jgi:hypothetical protein
MTTNKDSDEDEDTRTQTDFFDRPFSVIFQQRRKTSAGRWRVRNSGGEVGSG